MISCSSKSALDLDIPGGGGDFMCGDEEGGSEEKIWDGRPHRWGSSEQRAVGVRPIKYMVDSLAPDWTGKSLPRGPVNSTDAVGPLL